MQVRYAHRLLLLPVLMLPVLMLGVFGCRQSPSNSTGPDPATTSATASSASPTTASSELRNAKSDSSQKATASAQDVQAANKRLSELGGSARSAQNGDLMTEIVIQDGSNLTPQDFQLFGRLTDLVKLQIFNCRGMNDELASSLTGLKQLKSLAITNSVINDPTVELIAKSFPHLTELDLSSNTNMTRAAMQPIVELTELQSLTLVQTRFNDLSTRKLKGLQELKSLDLRGNMEAGNMTLEVVGELPKLVAFKHRSTAVTDDGMSKLAANRSLQNLLMQDFMISSQSGQHLAKLAQLKQLEIFRCQGFGSEGVLALKGLNLERLTLRDLPSVDDQAMEVFAELPNLRRLYLHELEGVTDEGFERLASLKSLELLDIWSVPQITDQAVEVISQLPKLNNLSLRSTAISNASIDTLLKMSQLQTLTIKENSDVSEEALERLSSRKWAKLDIGK